MRRANRAVRHRFRGLPRRDDEYEAAMHRNYTRWRHYGCTVCRHRRWSMGAWRGINKSRALARWLEATDAP